MPATVYQNPRSPVVFDLPPSDPREQPVCSAEDIRAAKIAHNQERIAAGYAPNAVVLPRFADMTADEMAVLDAADAVERLAGLLGSYRRVYAIVRTIAAIHGEAL